MKKRLKKMLGIRMHKSDIKRLEAITDNKSEFGRLAMLKELDKQEKENRDSRRVLTSI